MSTIPVFRPGTFKISQEIIDDLRATHVYEMAVELRREMYAGFVNGDEMFAAWMAGEGEEMRQWIGPPSRERAQMEQRHDQMHADIEASHERGMKRNDGVIV